jgi:hypothetical protein
MSPALALAHMWAARGTEYDPDLLALFAQILGRFPPGTLLELSDGSWGLSVSGARDKEHFEWPVVRIVKNADGEPQDGKEELDLYEVRDRIRLTQILDPASKGIRVEDMFELEKPAPSEQLSE